MPDGWSHRSESLLSPETSVNRKYSETVPDGPDGPRQAWLGDRNHVATLAKISDTQSGMRLIPLCRSLSSDSPELLVAPGSVMMRTA